MKKENVVFRTAINGYNKKDVYDYIEGVNKDIEANTEGYEKRIADLENEKNDVNTKLAALAEENSKLKEAIADKEQEISEKDELIDELDKAAVKISIELDALTRQYSDLVNKYETSFVPLQDVSELQKKADAYDRIIARVKEKKQNPAKTPSKHNEKSPISDKEDINNILTDSAQEILDHIKEAQARFAEAIENAQKESDMLKERVNSVMNSSKEKILSQIN